MLFVFSCFWNRKIIIRNGSQMTFSFHVLRKENVIRLFTGNFSFSSPKESFLTLRNWIVNGSDIFWEQRSRDIGIRVHVRQDILEHHIHDRDVLSLVVAWEDYRHFLREREREWYHIRDSVILVPVCSRRNWVLIQILYFIIVNSLSSFFFFFFNFCILVFSIKFALFVCSFSFFRLSILLFCLKDETIKFGHTYM